MNKTLVFTVVVLISAVGLAQKPAKPWNEWTMKEAEKVFNDSPWSRTQTESEDSQSSEVPTSFGDTRGREESVRNVSANARVTFHVRFFTARPIRQSYVRMLALGETPPDQATAEKMNAWANLPADDRIIVAVSFAGDQRVVARVARTFRSATAADVKNTVYLERNDGKRVFATDYVAPGKDAFGARFTFPRILDGQPFITPGSVTLRFHAEYDPKVLEASAATQTGSRSGSGGNTRTEKPYQLKLDVKFKISEMVTNGELEY